MKLSTWNVNGLRACNKKGFRDWLNKSGCHIVCLQETKLSPEQLPDELSSLKNWHTYYASAVKKGYSGVALYSSTDIEKPDITIGINIPKFDDEGRVIIAEYKNFILFSCYFPNGGRELARVPFKLEFSKEIAKKALSLHEEKGKPIIIAGDVNTAHMPIDLKNPKSNEKNTGFLPIERKWIDEFIGLGFHDVFREQHPNEEGQYTWWSYRMNSRKRNIGWRLDYFFVTKDMVKNVIMTAHSPETPGSDHCPTLMEINL
ncbi:MAG: exodeoxyribonuclease III [Bacteriovoracaceae bacterium]|nr:exodeoxyribonuclease III [Bacteriovoracaceae bacterium]